MTTDQTEQPNKPPAADKIPPAANRPLLDFTLVIGAVVVLAVAFVWWIGPGGVSVPVGGLEPGQELPEIVAEGWVNGQPPSAEQLEGKVLVVDAWFTTCPNCKTLAPELVAAYKKFHKRDVVFIGLTYEKAKRLPEIKRFLDETGIDWPNGYGALETLINLDVEYFPAVWVVGPDGRIVWNFDSPGELEDGIEQALALKR